MSLLLVTVLFAGPAATDVACPADSKAAYGAIVRALTAAEVPIEMKDLDAGVVRTEWRKTDVGTAAARGLSAGLLNQVQMARVRFTVLFADGKCTVKPEAESGWGKGGQDPSQWKAEATMNKGQLELQDRVLSAIKATAPTPVPTATPVIPTVEVSTISGTRPLPIGGEVVLTLVSGVELSGVFVGVGEERVQLRVGEETKHIKVVELKDARAK